MVDEGGRPTRGGFPPPVDGPPPLVYGHSGILPGPETERRGSVEIGAIPAHVRWNRENPKGDVEDEPDGFEPYVRLGVQEDRRADGQTVVLDEEQARGLRDAITEWLEAKETGNGE